jgi:hypothetical protein
MKDDLKKTFNDAISSELNKYHNSRKQAILEDKNERNSPEDYLIHPDDMKEIYSLVRNKKLSANKIREKIKDHYLKEPGELKAFLRSILDSKGKKTEPKEVTSTGGSSGSYETLFSSKETKKVETKEATSTASSGSYESPAVWAKSMGKKHWRNAKANYMPGAKRVQVKKKCKKFPYCNQGDIGALNIFENKMLDNVIKNISNKYDLHEDFIKEIISKEVNKRINK